MFGESNTTIQEITKDTENLSTLLPIFLELMLFLSQIHILTIWTYHLWDNWTRDLETCYYGMFQMELLIGWPKRDAEMLLNLIGGKKMKLNSSMKLRYWQTFHFKNKCSFAMFFVLTVLIIRLKIILIFNKFFWFKLWQIILKFPLVFYTSLFISIYHKSSLFLSAMDYLLMLLENYINKLFNTTKIFCPFLCYLLNMDRQVLYSLYRKSLFFKTL